MARCPLRPPPPWPRASGGRWAGPDRDDRGNEVGTMFVAIATQEGTHVRALKLGNRPMRERLRTQTASHALDLARRYLSGLDFGA